MQPTSLKRTRFSFSPSFEMFLRLFLFTRTSYRMNIMYPYSVYSSSFFNFPVKNNLLRQKRRISIRKNLISNKTYYYQYLIFIVMPFPKWQSKASQKTHAFHNFKSGFSDSSGATLHPSTYASRCSIPFMSLSSSSAKILMEE